MLDLNFINPFILGAVEVLQIQCQIQVEGGKPFLKGQEAQPAFAISSVIGLTSEKFKGAIILNFQEQFYLKVLSQMLGEEMKQINDETQDGAAELLNMIYGSAKTKLNAKGYSLERAIPTVSRGPGVMTSHGKKPTIVVPMRAECGQMHLEIYIEQS